MSSLVKIEYRLTARTAVLATRSPDGSTWVIPAASFRGAARHHLGRGPDLLHSASEVGADDALFGDESRAGRIHFSDATCSPCVESHQRTLVGLERVCGSARKDSLRSEAAVPAGTQFLGSVQFAPGTFGYHRARALSAVLSIPSMGRREAGGFGQVDVEILSRSSILVFVSYSWCGLREMMWVRNLAIRLAEERLDVLLDQLAPGFAPDAPPDIVNEWMTQAILNSDRILAILTPEYRRKAECGIGGVGLEYQRLLRETGRISNELTRYVGVLRSGDTRESVPSFLKNCPLVDLRPESDDEGAYSTLVESLLSP